MGSLLALAIFLIAVLVIVGAVHLLTHFLGEKRRKPEPGTNIPYESGVLPTGHASIHYPIDYYLIGMCFVIFDAAAIFLFGWAVSVRESGWLGFWALLIFMIETVAALLFLIDAGVFDWGKRRTRQHLRDHGYIQ